MLQYNSVNVGDGGEVYTSIIVCEAYGKGEKPFADGVTEQDTHSVQRENAVKARKELCALFCFYYVFHFSDNIFLLLRPQDRDLQ